MAKEVYTKLIDDMSGGEADETVDFGLDGTSYVIDLNKSNAEKLRKAIQPFAEKARKAGRGPGRPKGPGKARELRQYDIGDLREWAAGKKIDLPPRGRIKAEIIAQYMADMGK